jgi:hypothetical protein
MAGENRNHEEQWLDDLLRARADAEPRSGLEERVLARIASEPPRRVFALWPTLAAFSALIVIAIALIVLHTETPKQHFAGQTPQPEKPAKPWEDTPSLRASGSASSNREPQKHRRRDSGDAACCVSTKTVAGIDHHSTRESLPTLATFPALQPETAEERMMARLAARRNSFDLAAITRDPAPLDDLSVPKLKVEPMEGTPPDDTPRD